MKKVVLPAKLTIGFDYVNGEASIVRFDVKYRVVFDEYPEIPEITLSLTPTITGAQENLIKDFCRSIILPQILEA